VRLAAVVARVAEEQDGGAAVDLVEQLFLDVEQGLALVSARAAHGLDDLVHGLLD